jgi:hypothetical protein
MPHLSDHVGIFQQIDLKLYKFVHGPAYFNTTLLKRPDTRRKILEAWNKGLTNYARDSKGE